MNATSPTRRYWNFTDATAVPASEADAATATAEPPTVAPPLGAVSAVEGAALSTRVERRGLPAALPPASVATARNSWSPSPRAVVSTLAPNGAAPSTASMFHAVSPARRCSNATLVASADAAAERAIVPRTLEASASSVTSGSALSTVTVRVAEVKALPARSVTTIRRSAGPSGAEVVSHAVA